MINVRNALVYALPHIINNNLKLTKMPKVKTNSGARKNVWTVAKNTWEKGLTYAYRDRRNKKQHD